MPSHTQLTLISHHTPKLELMCTVLSYGNILTK